MTKGPGQKHYQREDQGIRPVWTALPGTAGMTDASMFDWGGDEGKCPQTRLWTQTSSDDGIGRGRRL
jgi:hypothetical protein